MPVTVINQPTYATARTNRIVSWVVALTRSALKPPVNAYPSDALRLMPRGFGSTWNLSIERLQLDDLPAEWKDKEWWPPLYAKRKAGQSKRIMIYYHGGGFVNEISPFHWPTAAHMGKELEADIMIQTYILGPHGGVHENIDKLVYLYQRIQTEVLQDGQELILCGDSAGGAIVATMLLALHDRNIRLPDQAVLIAPCWDTNIDTPENRSLERVDAMLSVDKLSAPVRAWAVGPTERAKLFQPAPPASAEDIVKMKHPYASPIYGNWTFLAKAKMPITLIQGTHDILLPKADEFVEKAKALDLELTYIRAEGACHVYPILSQLPLASYLAPDSIEGMRLMVESAKRYSKLS